MLLDTSSREEKPAFQQQRPPQIPPSPTLTNPDMILPYEEGERESSTPSPPFQLTTVPHPQSTLLFPKNGQHYDRLQSRGNAGSVDGAHIGVAISTVSRPERKGFPRHAWTYEGLDASRRLSDIGEEDSTASPPRMNLRNAGSLHVQDTYGLAGSPTQWDQLKVPESKEIEECSSSSSSTISGASRSTRTASGQSPDSETTSRDGHEVDLVGGNRQMRNDGRRSRERAWQAPSPGRMDSVTEEDRLAEDGSSVILSSEAERILENAKKRLTVRSEKANSIWPSRQLGELTAI